MKPFPTAISVIVTISFIAYLALIPLGYASQKSELESKVDAFLKVGDYDRAFKLVDGFLQEHSDTPIGYAMLERVITAGSAFLNAGDRKRAVILVDGYIQEHPAKPIGRAMMVRVLAADRQTDSAFKEYYRFYKLSETISPELLMAIVRGALNHSDKGVLIAAAETAENLDDKVAVPVLIKVLNDIKHSTAGWSELDVINVPAVLGALGDKRATPALIDALGDDDDLVRLSAINSLGELGDKSAVPYLIEALNDQNDDDTNFVVEALGKLGDKRASFPLQKVFKASESYDRVSAALALAKVGGMFYKEQSVTTLIEILNDDASNTQGRAAEALAEIGDERGVSALIDALNNNRNVSRGSAAQILLGEKGDTRAVPYLIDILNSRYNNTVRWRVAQVLGELGDVRAVPALMSALSSDGGMISNKHMNKIHMMMSGMVQLCAAEALVKLGDERGVPHLETALNDGDDDMRGYAAVALAELGDESIAPILVEILGGNERIGLKFWASEALVKLSR